MQRYYYSDTIDGFVNTEELTVIGTLAAKNEFPLEATQRDAWIEQIRLLKSALAPYRLEGTVYFEYAIPRLGRRIDVVALIGPVLFVLEFKVGEDEFTTAAVDQAWDYALDLKNFHEPSHHCAIVPIVIATQANTRLINVDWSRYSDRVLPPLLCNASTLPGALGVVLQGATGAILDPALWERGRYHPTPTIIEAATALYNRHSVAEISRSDAAAINLTQTSNTISDIIRSTRQHHEKAICFVTGVPGAGKTLVGLNIATQHIDASNEEYAVFLSGNGPLVAILREALARDKVLREKKLGHKLKKGTARRAVQAFIQNVHHFRDDCLQNSAPPIEHVALFDEAQRAWDVEQTSRFMKVKKKKPGFSQSEAEYLISCLDRHLDWAVVVCLVGGGQEINTGEAGITEWIDSVIRAFPHWCVHISPRLTDSEYGAGKALDRLRSRAKVILHNELHLAVSMRSFRAEHVSSLVKSLLDLETDEAARLHSLVSARYPIALTRSLASAKDWLRGHARGSERYGVLASSQALRLKPHALDVKSPMDPVHWFLDPKEDVRSSFYCEDVATEFHVQGLELDWACVTWDADFRHGSNGWEHWSFSGDRWKSIHKSERKVYLKNAYRVLLTRARQGMVIVVPEGTRDDPTRAVSFYDTTFSYLQSLGFSLI